MKLGNYHRVLAKSRGALRFGEALGRYSDSVLSGEEWPRKVVDVSTRLVVS